MTLPLNIEILQSAYDFLRTTQPFCRWNLPEGEDVLFRVTRRKDCAAQYLCDGRRHTIEISAVHNGHTDTMMSSMAHEMVHLHQNQSGMKAGRAEHDAAFHKIADQVCKIHGWDPRLFV